MPHKMPAHLCRLRDLLNKRIFKISPNFVCLEMLVSPVFQIHPEAGFQHILRGRIIRESLHQFLLDDWIIPEGPDLACL